MCPFPIGSFWEVGIFGKKNVPTPNWEFLGSWDFWEKKCAHSQLGVLDKLILLNFDLGKLLSLKFSVRGTWGKNEFEKHTWETQPKYISKFYFLQISTVLGILLYFQVHQKNIHRNH